MPLMLCLENKKIYKQIYSELLATAIHTVKPDNIATFLGHKLDLSVMKAKLGTITMYVSKAAV